MSHFLNRRDDKVFSSTLKSAQQRGDICHVRACNTMQVKVTVLRGDIKLNCLQSPYSAANCSIVIYRVPTQIAFSNSLCSPCFSPV